MPDSDILEKSVTANDYADNPQSGVFFLHFGSWPRVGALPPVVDPSLPFQEQDAILISTLDFEAIWAGAVAIAITKVGSLSWEIEGDIQLRVRRAQELLLNADAGRGWVSFLSKILQDFLLTNNGAFIEIVRDGNTENAPIIGLIPLDSTRCKRTGNADIPVQYTDLKGNIHNLQYYEVIDLVDMPSSRATLLGSGKCAAMRAYKSIYKLSNIETYVSDKVSGRRPLAVNLVNGLNQQQLNSILASAQSEADAKGIIAYMGAIIAAINTDLPINVATIPLADFPDNFSRKDELDVAILAYAANLGLDVQDIQPLTGQALGTGAQSQVLADKEKGKGLAAFRQQLTHALNMWVLPDGTTFGFEEDDLRDKKLKAEIDNGVESYVSDAVQNSIITADQGLQKLVDENVFDKSFLPVDTTPDDTLSDDEKPEDATAQPEPVQEPVIPIPTGKSVIKLVKEIQKELAHA